MSPENPSGGGGGTGGGSKPAGGAPNAGNGGDNLAVEALRRQLQDSLYPTLAAAVGVGFVLAGSGSSELGKGLLRLAGTGVAGQTLRMVAAALAKIDPDKARAALDLESRLGEPVNVQAAVSELTSSLRSRRRTERDSERRTGRTAAGRRDLTGGIDSDEHGANGGSRPGQSPRRG